MKKYMLIMALGFALAPMVFTASNHATIEKLEIVVVEDLSLVPSAPFMLVNHDLTIKLDFVAPVAIIIESMSQAFTEWKPFGKVRTKYHAEWLFNPDKLC
jgi:hypothetical protein